MIKKLISLFILFIFIGLIWSFAGRNQPLIPPQGYISQIQEINSPDSLSRTLVGIQPFMKVSDYFYQESFEDKLRIYLEEANSKGFLDKKSMVIFPEYLGTWLVIEGEKQSIAKKETLQDAMTLMVLSNFFEFGIFYFQTGAIQDKAAAALFKMKSMKMAKSYYSTFSNLSKEFKTYLLAGSIILPNPTVVDGKLYVDTTGDLVNASFIFGPDGQIIGKPILKAFPIESEQPFLSAKNPSDIPVFDLPLGKTSVLICADSWYPEAYQNAKNEQAELILVPSYCTGDGTMNNLWNGYSGYDEPLGTDLTDIGKITEQAAWEKYALPGQIGKSGAALGMNVFLRGELWDLGSDGQPLVVSKGKLLPIQPAEKAGIWALNF
ncbi:nitrilase-related carbon-nitrogen hydrolase [Algoriphagus sp. AK58]|uniref:nitrilase-related carbon-nitrogen hydrolase n=1 Tax=Algoriphagus sp. AK58 TaxID=1406877 RepID=UPI001650B907|nr:nitrilase-related carbon-nitrogen hydrolase [Algoriphagus sp. AK58]MBC6365896.1 carbon-nitrogen hydrolase [Algoriphagus sp. AK58]